MEEKVFRQHDLVSPVPVQGTGGCGGDTWDQAIDHTLDLTLLLVTR